jgi:Uma2 family endonuclease
MVMPLPVPVPSYTTDDLRTFPPDGCRYELVNGILLVTPAPAHAHQAVLFRLVAAIATYLGDDGPGLAVSPGVIEVAPSVHLEPDLLVHPAQFGPEIPWTEISGWWLAVEVSGRSSRRYDRDYKRDAYLALGVREVWLVDLDEKCVLVSRTGEPRDVRHAERLAWHPSEMAEPLAINLPRLFRGVP